MITPVVPLLSNDFSLSAEKVDQLQPSDHA